MRAWRSIRVPCLGGRDQAEIRAHLLSSIDHFYNEPSYLRSFAYKTIPVYGFLLAQNQPGWHLQINRFTNLTDYFKKALDLQPKMNVPYTQIANQQPYHFSQIKAFEQNRADQKQAQIAKYKTQFLGSPTLSLPFYHMKISFDYRLLVPLEEEGTVYPNLTVIDDWGQLQVNNGALITQNWSKVIVSVPTQITPDSLKGDGWTLFLNEGWFIEQNEEQFTLVQQ